MGSNSLPGKIWNDTTKGAQQGLTGTREVISGDYNQGGTDLWGGLVSMDPILSQIPGKNKNSPGALPDAPNTVDSRNAALDAQLRNELNIRRSMALVTGGQGVFGQPSVSTAGKSLVGS